MTRHQLSEYVLLDAMSWHDALPSSCSPTKAFRCVTTSTRGTTPSRPRAPAGRLSGPSRGRMLSWHTPSFRACFAKKHAGERGHTYVYYVLTFT